MTPMEETWEEWVDGDQNRGVRFIRRDRSRWRSTLRQRCGWSGTWMLGRAGWQKRRGEVRSPRGAVTTRKSSCVTLEHAVPEEAEEILRLQPDS